MSNAVWKHLPALPEPRARQEIRLPVQTRGWLLAAVVLVVLPHLPRLPWWLAMFAAAVALLALLMLRHPARQLPRSLLLLVTLAGGGGVLLHYDTLLGKNAGVALLVVMLLLKLLEVRNPRDARLAIFLCYFLVITNFLFTQSLLMAAYMFTVTLVITAALSASTAAGTAAPAGHYLRLAAVLLAQGLPLMLVLFLFFPRIEGPVWGLPKDAWAGMTGLGDSMSPGSLSKLVQSEAPAFRARFHERTPPAEQRYWRGPVLWQTDGRNWSTGSLELLPLLTDPGPRRNGAAYDYSITLEPHNKHWLLALDLPVKLSIPAIRTLDYQMLAHRPVRTRTRYNGSSLTRIDTGPLNSTLRTAALQLPDGVSTRVQDLAHSWREHSSSDKEVVKQALTYFNRQDFVYTLEPPLLGSDPVDEFLFSTRRGFCEHYAAAFVVLMRSAGIPARVVTGYQGGEYNPLGDYWLIRQSDAHAWAEVWLPDGGWQRIDPTAAVAPERIEHSLDTAGGAAGAAASFRLPDSDLLGRNLRKLRYLLDAMNNQWHEWVLSYGPQRQLEFLASLGIARASWKHMALALLLLTGLLLLGIALWMLLRQPAARDPVQRAWLQFCRRLARLDLVRRPGEGPRDFASRVTTARPELAGRVNAITELYVALRYGKPSDHPAINATRLQRMVQRFSPRQRPG
jgi:transglutaminase-like putative cysteine protease